MLHNSDTSCTQKSRCKFLLSLSHGFILVVLFFFIDLSSAFAQDPIVYSRCERTTTPYTVTADLTINGVTETKTKTFTGLDMYDALPDVTNFFSNFTAPCDLVYRDAAGDETIIYNCSASSTMENACAALDPAVSFDGKTIAFSVFKGPLTFIKKNLNVRAIDPMADSFQLGFKEMPNKRLKSEGAHLHFFNVETGLTTVIPYEVGIFDSGPTFISATRIAFTSTRDGNATTQVWEANTKLGTRIWTMDITGKNLDLASHHSLSQEQHPYLLKDGRLAYSSWQIFGGLPFRHTNGKAGGFTTLDNLFHIYTQNPDGSGNFPLYGQHSGDHKLSTFGENHNAAHFITQTSDERVWFTDYYRGNNYGLGVLVGVMAEPEGQEGINPYNATTRADMYVPHDVLNFAAWSTNSDTGSTVLAVDAVNSPSYSDPIPFAGKVGHPSALPANGLMLSWGKGNCSIVVRGTKVFGELGLPLPGFADGAGSGVGLSFMDQLGLDVPACDVGIYRATTIPSNHPNDLELIVDS
ncbi:MAG: hypothetical protein K0U40_11205, partial [Betaproteobacteria bacterium]|nr:hypothetical protein [Betaproteobacteria bacterium]